MSGNKNFGLAAATGGPPPLLHSVREGTRGMTTFAHGDATSSHSDLADCEAEVEDLRAALHSRPVIDQAKGVLIAETGCTPDEAFGMLSTASQRANRKVRDIAASIVEGAQGDSKPS